MKDRAITSPGRKMAPLPPALAASLKAFREGRPVIMVDDALRENEGDLVIAAEFANAEAINFMALHGRGLICLALEEAQIRHLDLPMMPRRGHDPRGTAFTVSIEATYGITTGISAADRARTIQLAAAPGTKPAEISTPGHVFPLRAHPGGCVARPGHTEGAIDLARLAGLNPAAVICEIIDEDGTMARLPSLKKFSEAHHIPLIAIADLIAWCQVNGREAIVPTPPLSSSAQEAALPVTAIADAALPSAFGGTDLEVKAFRADDGQEHLALIKGDPQKAGCLVRVHSECVTGDALGSLRCDCGPQLREALARIRDADHGVFIYLRGQEGRGIGLANKIRAYALQDEGVDTLDANLRLGLPVDSRNWEIAAAILKTLGARDIVLMTNNPAKRDGLTALGISVARVDPIMVGFNPFNRDYLTTKRTRMGHALDTAPERFLRDISTEMGARHHQD